MALARHAWDRFERDLAGSDLRTVDGSGRAIGRAQLLEEVRDHTSASEAVRMTGGSKGNRTGDAGLGDAARNDAARNDAATDRAALAALVEQHQASVWRYLRLLGADDHEADDLMQESFVVCAQRMQAGEPVQAPAAFLRGVARNLLLGKRRRERRQPPTVQWLEAVDAFVASQPEAIEDARIEALKVCLQKLSGRVQKAVQWHHVEGLGREEVARRLGMGLNGVKSLLGRARDSLRECVERVQRKESQ